MEYFRPKQNNDRLDLYRFTPDNHTVGTEEFYRRKLGDKFPDELYRFLEVKTRPEYTEEDINEVLQQINDYRRNYEQQLLKELEERQNENKTDELPDDIDLNKLNIAE
jgi:hypothetical protein